MARGRPSKKQVILDTARQLFAETGYQGTSIDLVVKQAGVSKPTVYNNFPTKQALLLAMIEELTDESRAYCEAHWQSNHLKPAEGIISIFEHIADSPAFLAVYRICYGESHKLEAATYELFKQFDTAVIEGYKQWLSDQKIALSEVSFLSIIAVCREGILIPALSGSPQATRDLIIQAVESQLKK